MLVQTTELTVRKVAQLTGWAESTVRKHAVALGGKRKGARKFVFTDEALRAGLEQLGKPNDLLSSAVES